MFEKIGALLSVFRAGDAAIGAARLQRYAMNAGLLAALIMAAAQAAKTFFGVTLPIDDDTALKLATGALALWGVIDGLLHAATNPAVGLPGLAPVDTSARDAAVAAAVERARVDVVEQATRAAAGATPAAGSMDATRPTAGKSQSLPVAGADRADTGSGERHAPGGASQNWLDWSRNGGA